MCAGTVHLPASEWPVLNASAPQPGPFTPSTRFWSFVFNEHLFVISIDRDGGTMRVNHLPDLAAPWSTAAEAVLPDVYDPARPPDGFRIMSRKAKLSIFYTRERVPHVAVIEPKLPQGSPDAVRVFRIVDPSRPWMPGGCPMIRVSPQVRLKPVYLKGRSGSPADFETVMLALDRGTNELSIFHVIGPPDRPWVQLSQPLNFPGDCRFSCIYVPGKPEPLVMTGSPTERLQKLCQFNILEWMASLMEGRPPPRTPIIEEKGSRPMASLWSSSRVGSEDTRFVVALPIDCTVDLPISGHPWVMTPAGAPSGAMPPPFPGQPPPDAFGHPPYGYGHHPPPMMPYEPHAGMLYGQPPPGAGPPGMPPHADQHGGYGPLPGTAVYGSVLRGPDGDAPPGFGPPQEPPPGYGPPGPRDAQPEPAKRSSPGRQRAGSPDASARERKRSEEPRRGKRGGRERAERSPGKGEEDPSSRRADEHSAHRAAGATAAQGFEQPTAPPVPRSVHELPPFAYVPPPNMGPSSAAAGDGDSQASDPVLGAAVAEQAHRPSAAAAPAPAGGNVAPAGSRAEAKPQGASGSDAPPPAQQSSRPPAGQVSEAPPGYAPAGSHPPDAASSQAWRPPAVQGGAPPPGYGPLPPGVSGCPPPRAGGFDYQPPFGAHRGPAPAQGPADAPPPQMFGYTPPSAGRSPYEAPPGEWGGNCRPAAPPAPHGGCQPPPSHHPATAPAAADAGQGRFEVGEIVEANFQAKNWWSRAKVAARHPDGSYDVVYLEGDYMEWMLHPSRLRPAQNQGGAGAPPQPAASAAAPPEKERRHRRHKHRSGAAEATGAEGAAEGTFAPADGAGAGGSGSAAAEEPSRRRRRDAPPGDRSRSREGSDAPRRQRRHRSKDPGGQDDGQPRKHHRRRRRSEDRAAEPKPATAPNGAAAAQGSAPPFMVIP